MYSLKLHKSSQLSSNRVNIRLSWNHLCQINYSITFHCRSGKFLLQRQQEASKYAKNIVSSWNVWDAITTVFQISTRITHYRFIHFSCPQSQSLPHSSKTHMVRSSHSNNLTYSLLPTYVLVTLMLLWKKKKSMTKSTYRREDLFGAYSFRGMGVYHHHGKEHISKPAGLVID